MNKCPVRVLLFPLHNHSEEMQCANLVAWQVVQINASVDEGYFNRNLSFGHSVKYNKNKQTNKQPILFIS